uniref:[Phe13]-bombesin receptor n=1 Tax=Magallana gigas TaxID=29159 RepID=K1RCX5_MAGGI|eukprot:XP_011456679.1 PREDICTED: cholecystokinin receptor type A [Crassostrea gigas]
MSEFPYNHRLTHFETQSKPGRTNNMASTSIEDRVRLSEKYSEQLLPNTVTHLIELAFGVFGNTIVLVMYSRYIADKSGTRYFIPILALVDLIGCLSNVTQFHLDNTMRFVYPSIHLCKTTSFLMIMSGGFSAHLILTIALQRYLMICRPFGQQLTLWYCRLAVGIIFLFSSGYAAPVLKFGGLYQTTEKLNTGNETRNISVSICHFDDGSHGSGVMVPYFGTLLLISFINIIVTSGLYIPVTKTIYRTLSPFNGPSYRASRVVDGDTRVTSRDTQSSSVEKIIMSEIPRQGSSSRPSCSSERSLPATPETSREQKARKKISVMFMVIIIVYVVSYLTSLVTQIHSFATRIHVTGYRLNIYFFCLRFNLLNHIANPYIYWFYDTKFRKELRKFCCGTSRKYSMQARRGHYLVNNN